MLTFAYLTKEIKGIEKKGEVNKTIAEGKHHTTGIRSWECHFDM